MEIYSFDEANNGSIVDITTTCDELICIYSYLKELQFGDQIYFVTEDVAN